MKMLILRFDDAIDLSAFKPDIEVAITAPSGIIGHVVANMIAVDPPTLEGTYNITPVQTSSKSRRAAGAPQNLDKRKF